MKSLMKYLFVAIFTMSMSGIVFAGDSPQGQRDFDHKGKPAQKSTLTEEQKTQLKDLRVAHLKETQSLKLEMETLRLEQKKLMLAEKPDLKKIDKSIDRMIALKGEMAKKGVAMRGEMREIFSEEQLMRMHAIKEQKGKGMREYSSHDRFHKGKKGLERKGHHRQGGSEKSGSKARKGHHSHRMGQGLNLTDGQKEQMKQIHMAGRKDQQRIQLQIQEKRASQKILLFEEQPDLTLVYQNIDAVSKLQAQSMKKRVRNIQEVRQLLDEDQRILFDSHMGKSKRAKNHSSFHN